MLEDGGNRVALAPHDFQHFRRSEFSHKEPPVGQPSMWDRWAPDRPTVVYFGTVAIGLTLFEVSEDVDVVYIDGKSVRVSEARAAKEQKYGSRVSRREMVSGRLGLRAYSPYPRASWEKRWIENRSGQLKGLFGEIERTLTEGATSIAKLVEEGERQAELERKRWEEQQRQWAREEDQRRKAKAFKGSRDELLLIVEQWSLATRIEKFFEDAARSSAHLDREAQAAVNERIARARSVLGGTNALERFGSWRSPEEREVSND